MLNKIIKFFLDNRLVTLLVLIIFISWGIINSPFGWNTGILPSDPVPVDAIPDIEKINKLFTQNGQVVLLKILKIKFPIH